MQSNSELAKFILQAKDGGPPRIKPGLYIFTIERAGVRASTRDGESHRKFFDYKLKVRKVLEDGTKFTLPPNPVLPPLDVGVVASTVVEVPGKDGYGLSEVKGHLKTLTGLKDADLANQAFDDKKNPITRRSINAKNEVEELPVTVMEVLLDAERSILSGVTFLGKGYQIFDKKTKLPRVDNKGNSFVKFEPVRVATAEEVAALDAK